MPSSISSSEARRRLRQWPGIVAAVLGAFALAEFAIWNNPWWLTFLARYSSHDSDMDPAWVTAAARSLEREPREPPIVLLGSSQVREGLDADLLEDCLGGRRCINFGLSGATPTDMLAVAADLDARAPRRVVVIGLAARMLDGGPKMPFVRFGDLPMVARMSFGQEMGAVEVGRLVVAASLCNLSPTLRHKDSIVALLDIIEKRIPEALKFRLPPRHRFKSMGEGYLTDEDFRKRVAKLTARESDATGEWIRLQRAAFFRLVRQETARGNPVLLFDFPLRPGSEGIFLGKVESAYRDLLREAESVPGVSVIDPREFAGIDGRLFSDISHVNVAGRREVTRRLCALLKRRLPVSYPHANPR